MPSPFPGMDPYLEDPELWSGFHFTFLAGMQERLGPVVRPKYFVRVEERVYVARGEDPAYRLIVPDLRVIQPGSGPLRPAATSASAIAEPIPVIELADSVIREHRLEVIDRVDRSVVTVVELLSPTNKVTGSAGRESFLEKRREVYASSAHWMEIDLLRAGTRTANLAATAGAEYQVFLSRAGVERRRGFLWPIHLSKRLPVIGIPLRDEDPDVPLDMQEILSVVYDRGSYDLDIDYGRDPVPPLDAEAADWARQVTGRT